MGRGREGGEKWIGGRVDSDRRDDSRRGGSRDEEEGIEARKGGRRGCWPCAVCVVLLLLLLKMVMIVAVQSSRSSPSAMAVVITRLMCGLLRMRLQQSHGRRRELTSTADSRLLLRFTRLLDDEEAEAEDGSEEEADEGTDDVRLLLSSSSDSLIRLRR